LTMSILGQCQKPSGWLGRFVLWNMNVRHSKVTDWGLGHLSIGEAATVLDVGCGGGRTVAKLAAAARQGKVRGIDYSKESVAAARRTNRRAIAEGRVTIQEASVTALPFPDDLFDVVTAVETHFWWDDPDRGMLEILRVLRRGGRLAIIAEFYNAGKHAKYAERLHHLTGMWTWTAEEHKELFSRAGFADVRIDEKPDKGWITVVGTKP
jgi:ubiquinone/menaquinone biosynthesis C-methylase UbiE